MIKSMMGHLFYTFIIITGIILAVLGFIIGRLFPFFAEQYNDKENALIEQKFENIIAQNEHLTESERAQIMSGLTLSKEERGSILKGQMMNLILVIAVILFCAFIILLISTRVILRNFAIPIMNVTDTAKELAVGNYRARAYANGSPLLIELKDSINKLAKNLESITKIRFIEEERLKTLVETMGSGLLMMNREGQVIIANRLFLKNNNMSYDEIIGKSFLTINIPDELKKFIDQVFFSEQPERRQIALTSNNELRHKQVFGAPVVGEHGKWLGIVIVLHDITELVRLEQVRRDFVANVSHELRTPITSINGFAETLLDGALRDEQMLLSFLEIIHKESQRLKELVNDLLDLSKLEQEGYEIDKFDVSIQNVLARVIEVSSQKLEEKSVELYIDLVKDIHVLGDENRLIQIFTNLVNNAIMYSADNAKLTISGFTANSYAVIEVKDEGVGLDQSDLQRVFERFYRVDSARSRNSGGTGLGLAIVKHLVELHKGQIEAESTLGVGTTMRVKIPLA